MKILTVRLICIISKNISIFVFICHNESYKTDVINQVITISTNDEQKYHSSKSEEKISLTNGRIKEDPGRTNVNVLLSTK